MKTITLGGTKAAGRVALVDDEDYELVMQHKWHVDERRLPSGRIKGPYAVATTYPGGRRTNVKMHKLITGWPQTDHINHNGLDNRRENLREASNSQNAYNQRPQIGRASAFKGVRWHPQTGGAAGGRWMAAIQSNGVVHHLGHFLSEEEAALAYDAAARELHGEFAYTNF